MGLKSRISLGLLHLENVPSGSNTIAMRWAWILPAFILVFFSGPAFTEIEIQDPSRFHSWLFLLAWFGGALLTLGIFRLTLQSWIRLPPEIGSRTLLTGSGSFLKRYQVVRVLGMGGMGIVYEGLDRGLLRKVAIKKMRGEMRVNLKERERFLREARTVAALRHPHIVEIHSIEEDGEDIYLIFEHLEGPTLAELIRQKGRLGSEEALKMFQQIGEGLAYAHGHNIIHRDLKPLNIMIDKENNKAKIMDFGLARQNPNPSAQLSQELQAYGTSPYMAPEQEQGLVYPESDIFALGVCLYEALTGNLPFPGNRQEAFLNKLAGKFTPVSQAAPGLSQALDEFFQRSLAPEPSARIKSVRQFLNSLERTIRVNRTYT